jgi:hypothetical protein
LNIRRELQIHDLDKPMEAMRRTSTCPTPEAIETIKIIDVRQTTVRNVEVYQDRQGLPGKLGPAQESFLNEPDQEKAEINNKVRGFLPAQVPGHNFKSGRIMDILTVQVANAFSADIYAAGDPHIVTFNLLRGMHSSSV